MRWIPRVLYGPDYTRTLELSLPQRLWTPLSVAVGGSDVSAAGIPESFVIRRDQVLEVRLLFREGEWPAVHDWIAWMQDNAGFCRFFPDRDAAYFRACYLDSPRVGDEVRPDRGEYPGTYEIGLRLRTTGTRDQPFDLRAYE